MQVGSMFVVVTAAEITPPLIYSGCNSASRQGIQYWYSAGVTQVICSKDLQKCFVIPYLLFSYILSCSILITTEIPPFFNIMVRSTF
jgi:hypothetical protein